MKVTVVGAGNVGATVANVLATKAFCSEVVLVDIKEGVPEGKAIDIMQIGSAGFFDKKRVAAHSLKSPDRTVDPAWKELLSLCEILVGMFSLQVGPPYLENC